jgi:hypothetical protein
MLGGGEGGVVLGSVTASPLRVLAGVDSGIGWLD